MEWIRHLAFALLGIVFVWAGLQHFLHFGEVSGMLRAKKLPFPGVLLAVGSAWEIAAGLALAAGVARPWAAGALIVFTCMASVMLLDFWRHQGPERQGLQSAFINNIAVVGGLLLAAVV
jgi:putative oxidoreductase